MTDAKPGGAERDGAGVERLLGELVPVDAPAALRERVLRSAREEHKRTALRPGMRMAAATATLIILACLAIDPLMGRREADRFEALLGGPTSPAPAETATELTEILAADAGELDRQIWFRALVRKTALENLERESTGARGGLKGRLEYEKQKDLY